MHDIRKTPPWEDERGMLMDQVGPIGSNLSGTYIPIGGLTTLELALSLFYVFGLFWTLLKFLVKLFYLLILAIDVF